MSTQPGEIAGLAEALSPWDNGTYSCACQGDFCESVPCQNDRDDLVTTVRRLIAEAWDQGHSHCAVKSVPVGPLHSGNPYRDAFSWSTFTGMTVCSRCGNKRCPAAWQPQKYECSGSNDPNQTPRLRSGGPGE